MTFGGLIKLALATALGMMWGLSYSQQTQPNIILIMADDLGYGDLSCYGSMEVHTPNIDRLAANGLKFLDYHSNGPVCSPTRAALMTGKYQQRTGVEGVITAANHREAGLSLDEVTMAEVLSNIGYNCGMFGKWHLGYDSTYNPLNQGFDQFSGFVGGNIDYHSHVDQAGYLDWWQGKEINDENGYTTDLITDYGVKYIRENNPRQTGKPFFLYLAQEAPHYPLQGRNDKPVRHVGSGDYIRKVPEDSVQIIYTQMIEIMDEGIGEIMKTVAEEGLDKNTIIIFCSDNGGAGLSDNGILRAGKGSVYEGGHRVPAIISYPGKIKAGGESDATVMSMDFLPTFVDLAGGKITEPDIDGISLKEHLLEGEKLEERRLYWSFKDGSAVRDGDMKLVATKKGGETMVELFNLKNDLSERTDLSAQQPELAGEMLRKLKVWGKEVRSGVTVIAE